MDTFDAIYARRAVKQFDPEFTIPPQDERELLAATAMGYASCPMIGFDIDEVAKLIRLPDDHVMGPMVAIGRGTKEPWPKPGQLPLEDLVFENTF